jgi:hypothetical protein
MNVLTRLRQVRLQADDVNYECHVGIAKYLGFVFKFVSGQKKLKSTLKRYVPVVKNFSKAILRAKSKQVSIPSSYSQLN